MLGTSLKHLLRKHALESGIIAEGETVLGHLGPPDTINISQARRILNVGHERARRVLQMRDLISGATRQGVAAPIDVVEVKHLAALEEGTLDAIELRNRLKIGKPQLTRLVREGLVVPHCLDYSSKRFLHSEVEDFLKRLTLGAPKRRRPRGAYPLPAACRIARVRLASVCKLILNGDVQPTAVGPGRLSFAKIFMKVSDLQSIRVPKHGLSIEEVARTLSIHPEVARYLARNKVLLTLEGERGTRIDLTSVTRFHRTHVTASELAQKLYTSPRYVTARLSGLGIHPVLGPPRCRQVFFVRDHVRNLVHDIECGAQLSQG